MNRLAACLCAMVPLLLGACASDPSQGYTFGSSHDTSIRTVHVPMFKNPTFQRGLEVELTDAIIKEIQTSTPWKVADGSVAETTLSGSITGAAMRRLTTRRDSGLAQELAYTITVDFDWVDARSGKTIASRRSFSASEVFVPSTPVGERLDIGAHSAVQQMARDIVGELRGQW